MDDAEVHRQLEQEALWASVVDILPDPVDQEVVKLILEGERDRAAYASVLKIDDWPEDERKREVDRVKDRLKKRLKRSGRAEFLLK